MQSNFIILFDEKEGSTPLVQLLDNFALIDVVHLDDEQGWEPFDAHNCGEMAIDDFRACLDLIWGRAGGDRIERLNAIYTSTGRLPIVPFDGVNAVGFKMRFRPHRAGRGWLRRKLGVVRFERTCIDAFLRHDVVVLFAFRQDVLRWALSKYHGDGTGRPGHLQFDLARRSISRSDIPPIRVDLDEFGRLVAICESIIASKRALATRLQRRGIETHALAYEDFCEDRPGYFERLLAILGVESTDEEIRAALARGTPLRKVHDHDIGEFIENAGELLDRFGEPFVTW